MEVKVASYVVSVVPVALQADNVPPLTLISPSVKSVVDSVDVNVRVKDPSLVRSPLTIPPDAVIVGVGAVVSTVIAKEAGLDAPVLSVAVTVSVSDPSAMD